VALYEWGLTPDVINERWSPELLWLMFYERRENIRMLEEMQRVKENPDEERRYVSDVDLFKKMKIVTRA